MEKRMVNGHRGGDLVDLSAYFNAITIDSDSASSFVTPAKLLPPYSPPQLATEADGGGGGGVGDGGGGGGRSGGEGGGGGGGSSASSFVTPSLRPQTTEDSDGCGGGGGGGGGGLRCIEHKVSRFDTLAGVAIKYGVEVADIKKMNGLVTDHQMFALKTLNIPLPGRHPPSPIMTNGVDNKRPSSSESNSPGRRHSDIFDSIQSLKLKSYSQWKVSPAMSASEGYYGPKQPAEEKVHPEGFEMAVYNNGGSLEDGTSSKSATPSNLRSGLPRKCRSAANGFYSDNGNLGTQEAKDNDWGGRWIEKFVRRRPQSEIDLNSRARDTLLKEENNSGGIFSALASKGLALRPKSGNRNVCGVDAGGFSSFLGDPLLADSNGVRKSSSSPSFHEQENSTSSSLSSIWPTWSLKPDLQALSTAAITKPIFDGLPLPISGRKSKTALD